MKYKRFYFNISMIKGEYIYLSDDEFVHAFVVLRQRVGDKLCLFCGDGKDYICTVEQIDKRQAILKIDEVIYNDIEPNCKLTIFQALAKGDKLSLIAQKLTEIGVAEFKTFYSKFCNVKPNTTKLDRLNSVVISACKQCGRSELMKVETDVLTFCDLTKEIKNYDRCYLAYENEQDNDFVSELLKAKNIHNICVIIGPEGGFDVSEVKELQENGAVLVTLGKRILRTETCAILAGGLVTQILK